MKWIFIISALIIIVICLVTTVKNTTELEEKARSKIASCAVGFIVAGILWCMPMVLEWEKEAYINSLKGKNKYRIEVRTEFRDGKFYDSDTLYIKIKK